MHRYMIGAFEDKMMKDVVMPEGELNFIMNAWGSNLILEAMIQWLQSTEDEPYLVDCKMHMICNNVDDSLANDVELLWIEHPQVTACINNISWREDNEDE